MREQEEKPKKSITWLIVALIVGIMLIAVGTLASPLFWHNTSQNQDIPRYTQQTAVHIAVEYAANLRYYGIAGQFNGFHVTGKGYATYLGNGIWKVEVYTFGGGTVTVYVNEKTGYAY